MAWWAVGVYIPRPHAPSVNQTMIGGSIGQDFGLLGGASCNLQTNARVTESVLACRRYRWYHAESHLARKRVGTGAVSMVGVSCV